MGIAQTRIERAPQSVIDGLASSGVAAVHDAQGREGLLACDIRPLKECVAIAGSAVTVSVPPGDHWMVHVAIELLSPGDVLVVAPTSRSDHGYFGESLGVSAQAHGAAGAVVDAGVRDVRRLKESGFPVWSRVICARGTGWSAVGNVNVPVICGGQRVEPGDVVVADDDGVCIVARDNAAVVLERSRARLEADAAGRLRLSAGEYGLDVYQMRSKLRNEGFEWI